MAKTVFVQGKIICFSFSSVFVVKQAKEQILFRDL